MKMWLVSIFYTHCLKWQDDLKSEIKKKSQKSDILMPKNQNNSQYYFTGYKVTDDTHNF